MMEVCAIDFPSMVSYYTPYTLGGLSVTDLVLLMGDGYLKISKSGICHTNFEKKFVSTDMFQMT